MEMALSTARKISVNHMISTVPPDARLSIARHRVEQPGEERVEIVAPQRQHPADPCRSISSRLP
ncbi:hypothetical protein LJR042_000301 [Microbacterium maritypicum]|uniref:hypothetical protein n=1 Tax=Microbacterium TaxID=33882 RepID=UPI001422AC16|nr:MULTISPECIES: hypothetical protein [Microbacterium]